MKTMLFLLLSLFTLYLAGMYRYPPLLLLAVAELLLLPVMFALAHYFKGRLAVEFLQKSCLTEKDTETACQVRVRNRGILPLSRFRIGMRFCYKQESGAREENLYGACGCGENILQFAVYAPYCGIINLRMKSMQVYDYLSLFLCGRRLEGEMQIAVYPKERALKLKLPSLEENRFFSRREENAGHIGNAGSEIRQIREYRTGDVTRHIHWNQSAKMDMLWIKEYEKETELSAKVLLDAEIFNKTTEEMDAFYELLSALVLGLLQNAAVVKVYFEAEGQRRPVYGKVTNAAQCRDMLLCLYRMESKQAAVQAEGNERNAAGEDACFRLDPDLGWYYGETLLYRFSRNEIISEIDNNYFVL